ncbi:type II toxin-antitoxin system death-on-curing family toxin [Sulfobacillus thermosulfidooxidans]|uniref:type II toxin-antitoxin system death-on-curing family toxin n=1 Tax=Sulfobacillus thermosulfidooxidans TaxID=28034 RepID=UPI0006B4F703|nr:type II toxin-antitoxin system death-on-curing family toxin [Sulfobacillus thermosulfidooxidans]
MRYLTIQEVLFIHFQVIDRFGGMHGVLNLGGLESAVARPLATMGGDDLYASMLEKAAVLLHSLVLNHPFQDGNKRTAFTALGLFLHYNGMALDVSSTDAENFVVNVADKHVDVETIVEWLQSHTRSTNN